MAELPPPPSLAALNETHAIFEAQVLEQADQLLDELIKALKQPDIVDTVAFTVQRNELTDLIIPLFGSLCPTRTVVTPIDNGYQIKTIKDDLDLLISKVEAMTI